MNNYDYNNANKFNNCMQWNTSNLKTVPWSGWYAQNGQKLQLHFSDLQIDFSNRITGSGVDNQAAYTLEGVVGLMEG